MKDNTKEGPQRPVQKIVTPTSVDGAVVMPQPPLDRTANGTTNSRYEQSPISQVTPDDEGDRNKDIMMVAKLHSLNSDVEQLPVHRVGEGTEMQQLQTADPLSGDRQHPHLVNAKTLIDVKKIEIEEHQSNGLSTAKKNQQSQSAVLDDSLSIDGNDEFADDQDSPSRMNSDRAKKSQSPTPRKLGSGRDLLGGSALRKSQSSRAMEEEYRAASKLSNVSNGRKQNMTTENNTSFDSEGAEHSDDSMLGELLKVSRLNNGTFYFHRKVFKYDQMSLYFFSDQNRLRCAFVWLATWNVFENIIITCILLNSLTLAAKNYQFVYNKEADQGWNKMLEIGDLVFTFIFTAECVIKIIAMGFVRHNNSYLKNGWNILDFFIVAISLFTLTGSGGSQLKILRTMRVLRPLRTISSLPSMRKLIMTFFQSIPGLMNVAIFLSFFFAIFAIFGVVTFSGSQYNFCRATEELIIPEGRMELAYWPMSEEAHYLCKTDEDCARQVSEGAVAKCGNIYNEYGLDPAVYDNVGENELIFFDIVNFNNFGRAGLLIFQVLTMEGWAMLMYNFMDGQGSVIAGVFFIGVVILGAFVSMNLFLAQIMHSFLIQKKNAQKQDAKQAVKTAKRQEENSLRKSARQNSGDLASSLKNESMQSPSISRQTFHNQNTLKQRKESSEMERSGKQFYAAEQQTLKMRKQMAREHNDVLNQLARDNRNQSGDVGSKSMVSNEEGGISESVLITDNKEMAIVAQLEELEKIKKDKDEQQLIRRARQNYLYWVCLNLVESVAFNILIYIFIVANTITLAMDTYDMTEEELHVFRILNYLFAGIFFVEMIIKLIGLGCKGYMMDAFNVFDFVIVMLSVIDLALEFAIPGLDIGYLKMIRALRLLRTIKLARQWTAFQNILRRMLTSMIDVSNFLFLLLIVIFIFSLLGMELFAYAVAIDEDGNEIYDQAEIIRMFEAGRPLQWPRINFNNVWQSMMAVFITIQGEDWQNIMYPYTKVIKEGSSMHYTAIGYFVMLMIIGYVVLMALFTGILLRNFEDDLKLQRKLRADVKKKKDDSRQIWESSLGSTAHSQQPSTMSQCSQFCFDLKEGVATMFAGRDLSGFKYRQASEKTHSASPSSGSHVPNKSSGRATRPATTIVTTIEPDSSRPAVEASESAKNGMKQIHRARTMGNQSNRSNRSNRSQRSDNEESKHDNNTILSDKQKSGRSLVDQAQRDNQVENDSITAVHKQTRSVIFHGDAHRGVTPARDVESTPLEELNNFNVEVHRPRPLLHYDPSLAAKFISHRNVDDTFGRIEGSSLMLFKDNNILRRICIRIARQNWFNSIIMILIVFSTIMMAFEDPISSPDTPMNKLFRQIDAFITIIFLIEAVIKIISLGFIINGKYSYLRDPWNILDFAIVLSSTIGLIGSSFGVSDFGFVKALRFLRVMRPLRTVKRIQSLKLAVTSLFKAIPGIANLSFVVAFYLFMLAILMTTLFSGTLFSCELPESMATFSLAQQEELIQTKWDCLNLGGEWVRPDMNFDTTGQSLISLTILTSKEGWIDLMFNSVDAKGVNRQPMRDAKPFMVPVFFLLIVLIALLFVNLFVGVVIETFNVEKENINPMLHVEQRTWLLLQIQTYSVRPMLKLFQETDKGLRAMAYRLVTHKNFDAFITGAILANTFVLGYSHFGMTEQTEKVTDMINQVFMVIFTAECVIKIYALHCNYFKDSWNIFDFTVVVLTLVILILTAYGIGKEFSLVGMLLRTLRTGRIFRLVKRAQTLQITFQTLIVSAPSICSLGLLLMMMVFMFAIIGQSLFTGVKIDEGQSTMDEAYLNFHSFWTSFLTLIRSATGEGWNGVMYDMGRSESILFQCRNDQTYEEIRESGGVREGCGNFFFSVFFFILFQITVSQIFLNLFIAIIIDAFLSQNDLHTIEPRANVLQEFTETWSSFDREASGFMTLRQLEKFIITLASNQTTKSMFIEKERQQIIDDAQVRRNYLASLRIPTYGTFSKVLFYDTLQQMCLQINAYNKHKLAIEKMRVQASVLSMLGPLAGASMKQDFLENFAEEDQADLQDLDSVINSVHAMSPRIELLNHLKESIKSSFNRYFELVDTNLNLHLTQAERVNSGQGSFQHLLNQLEDQELEVNVFSKRHIQVTAISSHIECLDPSLIRHKSNPIRVVVYTTEHFYAMQTILKAYRNYRREMAQMAQDNILMEENKTGDGLLTGNGVVGVVQGRRQHDVIKEEPSEENGSLIDKSFKVQQEIISGSDQGDNASCRILKVQSKDSYLKYVDDNEYPPNAYALTANVQGDQKVSPKAGQKQNYHSQFHPANVNKRSKSNTPRDGNPELGRLGDVIIESEEPEATIRKSLPTLPTSPTKNRPETLVTDGDKLRPLMVEEDDVPKPYKTFGGSDQLHSAGTSNPGSASGPKNKHFRNNTTPNHLGTPERGQLARAGEDIIRSNHSPSVKSRSVANGSREDNEAYKI